MEENKIKFIIFASLFLFTILLFSFTIEDQANTNYYRDTIISNVDQTLKTSLENQGNNDCIIIQGNFVGMFEAEFYKNSTKIIIADVN